MCYRTTRMYVSGLLLVLIGCFGIGWVASNPDEKCDYKYTVNLTNHQPYDNRSYVYQNTLIPPDRQALYKYHVLFHNEEISVPEHLRGCVCDNPKPCFKLCCDKDQFFDLSAYKCEKLSDEVVWNLDIQLKKDDEIKNVNIFDQFIYQLGVPCRNPEALIEGAHIWSLLEDGVLYVENDDSYLDTLNYCYTPHRSNESEEYLLVPLTCPTSNDLDWNVLLNTYAMTISVIFLIPTIVVYLIFKELRGNLRGKLLIAYLISLTIGYSILSFINITEITFSYIPCISIGYICYFFLMSAFLWLSVLCYDIWCNFKETYMDQNTKKNQKRFIYYSVYAWGLSTICTMTIIAIDLSPGVPYIYKTGIDFDLCWLDTFKWSPSIYFFGPNLIILIFNSLTFAHLTMRIYKVRRDLAKMTRKEKFFQENSVVILRLFLIMGISWVFDFLSYLFLKYKYAKYIFLLSDFANAIQGVLIFSLFVLKPNVLNLCKKRYNNITSKNPRSVSSTSATNFSKLQTTSSIEASQTCASHLTP